MEKKNLWYWGGGLLLVTSLIVRVAAYPIVVSDYTYFLAKWFLTLLVHPGLSAFQTPFSDYAPLYLYFLKLLTFIPVASLYSIKTLSGIADILIAFGVYLIVKKTLPSYNKGQLFFVFALVFSIPTLLINSSLWGQSDALYGAPLVFSLYFLLLNNPLLAAIAFGIGISIKVQAIFFLPVLIGYLLRKKEHWWYLLIPPATFILSTIPAWIAGGSLRDLLTIYFHQAGEYPWLDVSSQSMFAFVNNLPLSGEMQTVLFWVGMALAALSALWIVALIVRPIEQPSSYTLVYLSLLCVLLVPFLLPRMHERYFYLGDIFSVLYAFYRPKQGYIPVLIIVTSFLAYMPFLAKQVLWFSALQGMDLRIPASILLITLVLLCIQFKRTIPPLLTIP